MRSRSRSRSGLFASLILVFAACGGRSTIDFGADPGAAGAGGVGATGGAGGGVSGGGGLSGGGGAGGGVSGGGGAGGGVSGGGGGGSGGSNVCADPGGSPCETCTCSNCLTELKSCDADGGCLDILACVWSTGCKGIQCYAGPCKGVIDKNGGPLGKSVGLAQQVGQCQNANQCPCSIGTGGTGGGGSGGSGGSNSGGGGGTGPIACIGCIVQKCPSVQECLFDQACRNGAICAMQKCVGGGGGLNLQCMLGCFNGDFQAAFKAFQSLQCFFANCGQTCGGLIPGLPGGGPPGGGPPGGG